MSEINPYEILLNTNSKQRTEFAKFEGESNKDVNTMYYLAQLLNQIEESKNLEELKLAMSQYIISFNDLYDFNRH